jgi:hypothetical protein
MKKTFLLLAVSLIIFSAFGIGIEKGAQGQTVTNEMINLTSNAFQNGERIPQKYTCDGSNASPDLNISNIPSGTKSLALIVDDPDAPMGNFNHWVMWNISPTVSVIPENSFPEGAIQGVNDGEHVGYVGPCPPSGTHRYYFKVYALDTMLDLSENAKKADLEKAIIGHVVGEGELLGKYSR